MAPCNIDGWRFEIRVEFVTLPDTTFQLRDEIKSWLDKNNIDYRYTYGYVWLLKTQEDATLFILRWS